MNQLVNIFKLLSDETRLRILMLLFQEELCVCQLSGILDVPQPRVSQSLSKMRDMGLVSDERQEKYIFYSLKKDNATLVNALKDILDQISSYPQLGEDQKGLKDKAYYLENCGTSCKR